MDSVQIFHTHQEGNLREGAHTAAWVHRRHSLADHHRAAGLDEEAGRTLEAGGRCQERILSVFDVIKLFFFIIDQEVKNTPFVPVKSFHPSPSKRCATRVDSGLPHKH